MTRFLHIALGFFALATGLGVVLRYAQVEPVGFIDAGKAIHAHSHTLYFGWAGLALFTLMFDRVGALADRRVRSVLWGVVIVSVATFAAFLHSGYGRPGIIVSALSLVVWGAAVVLFLRRARGQRGVDVTFLRVAVVYVLLASVSALSRVVVLVAKVADPMWGKLAVYGFLHAFAGFFIFSSMGLLVRFLASRGAPLDAKLLRLQLGWMAPLVGLTFPLAVPGATDTPLGPMARLATVLLVIPAAMWTVNLWSAVSSLPTWTRLALRTTAVAWALKTIFELSAAFGMAELVATGRHAVILELHLVLLGVVTTTLFLLVRARLSREGTGLLVAHQGGVLVLSTGLLLAALASLGGWPTGIAGLWLAAAGGVLVYVVDAWLVVECFVGPSTPHRAN